MSVLHGPKAEAAAPISIIVEQRGIIFWRKDIALVFLREKTAIFEPLFK